MIKRSYKHILTFVLYSLIGFIYFGNIHALENYSHYYFGIGSDPILFMWSLSWWPYALKAGINPFISHYIFAPVGVNLTWTTSIPGLALILAPLTSMAGPVSSYNIISILVPILSAFTAYLLVWHVAKKYIASIIGGYLYGFSTYEIGQMLGHLHLTAVFLIPVAVLLYLYRTENDHRRAFYITWLTLLLVCQFLISTEVFATATMFGGIALLIILIMRRSEKKEFSMEIEIIKETIFSYVIVFLILSPYFYYIFKGYIAHSINGPDFYSADLFSYIIPTPITWLGGDKFSKVAGMFPGNFAEEGAYIGLPIVFIIYLYVKEFWHTFRGKLLTILGGIIFVLSLGPLLHILGVRIIRFPWEILRHFPFLSQALPTRFTLYLWLIIGIMIGLWIVEGRTKKIWKVILVLLSVGFIIPNIPSNHSRYWSTYTTPQFFSHKMYKQYLSKKEFIIVIPYASLGNRDALLWQAESDFYFKMPEGAITTIPQDFKYIIGSLQDRNEAYLPYLLQFIIDNDVKAIVVEDSYEPQYKTYFSVFHIVPVHVGGVWYYPITQATLSYLKGLKSKIK